MSLVAVENPRAVIGHNAPPPLAEILAERYAEALADVDQVASRASALPKTVTSDADLGRVGDVVKDARKLAKGLDASRKVEVEPHLTAQRETNAFFAVATDRLEKISKTLEARATDYQRAKAAEERRRRDEEARKAREEQDRQREIAQRAAEAGRQATVAKAESRAEEAAERAAQAETASKASAADLTRTRSSTGTVATTRTTWDFEIVDLAAVPLDAIRPYLPRADIEKALRGYVKMGGRQLAGVRIFENETAAFR